MSESEQDENSLPHGNVGTSVLKSACNTEVKELAVDWGNFGLDAQRRLCRSVFVSGFGLAQVPGGVAQKLLVVRQQMKPVKALMLSALAWCCVHSALAQTWMQVTPYPFYSVASSADGQNLVAAIQGGWISTSTNSGGEWAQTRAPSMLWNSVASSADGSKLVGAVGGSESSIFTSTNSGQNWTSNNLPDSDSWFSVASSADGTKLVTAGAVAPIYTSTNSGLTWIPHNPTNIFWLSVASSADGTKLAALGVNNPTITYDQTAVYTSTNSGTTWTQSTNLPPPSSHIGAQIGDGSIASSADGTELVAVVSGQGIYISTDSGGTWVQNIVPSLDWSGVACSADGTKLVAVTGGYYGSGPIYVSTNAGESWSSNSAPTEQWTSVATSADGQQLVAACQNGIYISQSTPSPLLNMTLCGGNVILSWTVPSRDFVLQQSSGLTPTDWKDVTNTPVLNLTNLQEQVVLSPSNSGGYYRLATP